jgi:protein-disulfide isomerase
VQLFLIKAFCTLCVLTYALDALAFMILLPTRRAGAVFLPRVRYAEGRVALVGWVIGTVGVAAAVVAADRALAARAGTGRADASLLGAPVAPASGTAPAGGDLQRYQEEARVAHEEARRLQEILDDPRKLEEYFSAKAQRDHDAAPVAQIDLANVPMRGPAEAPVTVVEYSDFLCPYCKQLAQALVGFMPTAGGRIKVYFKNYPLESTCNPKIARSVHTGSCALALGGLCAQNQGKFEAYHDRVFATDMHSASTSDVLRIAGEAGLNAQAMEGCLDDPRTKAALDAQIAEGNRLGITSTPTVYIDGKKLPQINYFVAIVDKEARKKGSPPLAQAGH